MQMGLNGQTPPGASPAATTPQQFHQQMVFQQAQQPAQGAGAAPQRQASGTRPHSMAFEGATPIESGANTTRDNTPPERKRQRRNSGSAAPSPFVQPQTLQPGFQPQPPHLQTAGIGMQQQMQQMIPGMPNGPPAQSPANAPTQSPRNATTNGIPATQAMQRNQSKGADGSMPPPQSPASGGMGRTPGAQNSKLAMTPKTTTKDAATPKSVRNSPQAAVAQPETAVPAVPGLTPSPPTANATPSGSTAPNGPGTTSAPASAGSGGAAATTAPAANGTADSSNNSLFGAGDMLDSNLFGTDADLDWMTNLTAGPDGAFDFTTYLENIGEDNDGEVGVV